MVYYWLHETDCAEKWVSPTFLIVQFRTIGGVRQQGRSIGGTMKHEFYAAISQIAAERGIPKEAIIEVMESRTQSPGKKACQSE